MNSLTDDSRQKKDRKTMSPQEGRIFKGQQQSKSTTDIIEGNDNQEKKELTNDDMPPATNNKLLNDQSCT